MCQLSARGQRQHFAGKGDSLIEGKTYCVFLSVYNENAQGAVFHYSTNRAAILPAVVGPFQSSPFRRCLY
jgi:hypothetical protein